MNVRYAADRQRFQTMTGAELRDAFLLADLFEPGKINLVYCETERAVVGGAVPATAQLSLIAGKELAADFFCQRREAGALNIGGPGKITVDGKSCLMANLDCLYIGRGSREIVFESDSASDPARFYVLSYPAHADFPTTHAKKSDAEPVRLGTAEESNVRTIFKCIHPGGVKSCQLVMGFTVLEPGSVWNTMPGHTHERRSEVYLYFNLAENAAVFHFMGPPGQTRHLVLSDAQAVISPMWSIHSGVGTRAYTFCWGMGGENQDFGDMDPFTIRDLG